jgi:metal-responsive CopG/Arc/MetJ family transcriptional regulator
MGKEKFGVAVDKEIVQEVDELVAECADLGASRSEIVEAILTAFVQSESNHAERVREIIIGNEKALSKRLKISCTRCTTF